GRVAAELSDPRGRRSGPGATDPGSGPLARWQAPGVLGPDAALRDGPPRGEAAADLGRGCARVPPELVARRRLAGLGELVAGGGSCLEAPRRRHRRADPAHASGRLLSRPGLVA